MSQIFFSEGVVIGDSFLPRWASASVILTDMIPFALFCKSYRNDILRVKRLVESIRLFNRDQLPFFLSIPREDIAIFKQYLPMEQVQLVIDDEIIAFNKANNLLEFKNLSGYIGQQVVKAEAWRMINCQNYLCIDSDAYFIRDFYLSDFVDTTGNPYILLHDCHDLLNEAREKGVFDVISSFNKDSMMMKEEFGRTGPSFDFGPAPLIWSRTIWEHLNDQWFAKKNENIINAFKRLPHEIRWYGEAYLHFQPNSFQAIKPLFYVQHYDWQTIPNSAELEKNYLGIIKQSNWDKSLDPPFARKPFLSRLWKRLKGS